MAKPVPDGYHTVTPYLTVRGAAQAIEFYTRAFGAQELEVMPGPDGTALMHAEIKIGDSVCRTWTRPSGGQSTPGARF